MGSLRSVTEENENLIFSPFAFKSADTKGRVYPCEPDVVRTEFQRDRDRIIHSQSFRRLMNKTQVFLAPVGDHYRTRLTHTLEVCQIARTIARALRLNEDLAEAIALGHDLGHTPFGHSGESVMQECYSPDFTHYKQSLRVVDVIEKDGKGLNLTYEVRDGIVNHTVEAHPASTLEGIIVFYADHIAYINHDIDDACRAGVLKIEDIPKDLREILGERHSQRINTMVMSIVRESTGKNEIKMEPEIRAASDRLHKFMFDSIYYNPVVKGEEKKSKDLLTRLFEYYVKHPTEMTGFCRKELETEPVERCVCDFISGMTDRYAIETYRSLFIPEVWRGRK